eukprot:162777-Ditylum_brightwellii.AAC.1
MEQTSQPMISFCAKIGTTLRSDCPLALWDYSVEQRAQINILTAKDSFKLNGTTPHTALQRTENELPFNKEVLGHVLGPTKGEGNEVAQW